MKKKLISFLLAVIMVCSMMPSALAATDEATEAAQTLYELGLFRGTGTNADGTPIFDLDKTPTRNQAIIMLVRLLGKEEEALAGTWDIPFTDVTDAMRPYIGYAYKNGLTNGYTATTYCGTNPIKANQYIAFVLRALGYASGEDFEVGTSYLLSDKLGITDGTYANATEFTRGDVAEISLKAHALQTTDAVAFGLPADIKWIDKPKNQDDIDNNILYSFLNGNYSLNFTNLPDELVTRSLVFTIQEHIKTMSWKYPELVGVFCNQVVGCGSGSLTFIDFPGSDLDTAEVYRQQCVALDTAKAIKAELHKSGKITGSMTELQIAQVYYDYLGGLNVQPGGGEEAAARGESWKYDTPYACLVNRAADCVGRAGAFNLLMHLEGIAAEGVHGQIRGSNVGHVISRVTLDGKTYYCDWGNRRPIAANIDSWFAFD